MMRWFRQAGMILATAGFTLAAAAQAQQTEGGDQIAGDQVFVAGIANVCVQKVMFRNDKAVPEAVGQGLLLPLAPENEKLFLRGREGKAWRLAGPHDIVVMNWKNEDMCMVMARVIDQSALVDRIGRFFVNEASPFKPVKLDRPNAEGDSLEYCGRWQGRSIMAILTSSEQPRPSSVQAMMSVSPVQTCPLDGVD